MRLGSFRNKSSWCVTVCNAFNGMLPETLLDVCLCWSVLVWQWLYIHRIVVLVTGICVFWFDGTLFPAVICLLISLGMTYLFLCYVDWCGHYLTMLTDVVTICRCWLMWLLFDDVDWCGYYLPMLTDVVTIWQCWLMWSLLDDVDLPLLVFVTGAFGGAR